MFSSMYKLINQSIMSRKILIYSLLTTLIYGVNGQQTEQKNTINCPFEIGVPKPVTKPENNFNRSRISPDGSKLIVTKQAYQGIYVIDLKNNNSVTKVTEEPRVGFEARWKEQGKAISFKSSNYGENKTKVSYDIQQKSIIQDKPNNLKASSINNSDIEVKYNLKRRKVEASNGNKTWDITPNQGLYYDLIISPDYKKVLVHENDGNMYIFALDGSGLINNLGHGLARSWTPNGDYIIYFVSEDNGQSTTASDIYICSIIDQNKWKLTDTKNSIEMWPHLSKDGKVLTYYDLSTKRIYVTNFTRK